ncbi:hypothetical protein CLU79DRAFT_781507 [Phycomyces nitens]|nr:hypothetical protein CLU79DRAFT_781507 [Phycomyces nitens]
MDYQDSFPTAPVRYALDDGESDEEISVIARDSISITTTVGLTAKRTLILGLSGPGSVFIESLQGNAKTVGQVNVQKNTEKIETLPVLDLGHNVLGLPLNLTVPQEQASQYAASLLKSLKTGLDRVIILDSFTAAEYTCNAWGEDLQPPYMRVLQTSTTKSHPNLVHFEAPNMVKGFEAALITYCEIHSIPCYSFLTLQESMLGKRLVTTDTLDGYLPGLQALGLSFNYDETKMNEVLKTRKNGRVDKHHHRLYL